MTSRLSILPEWERSDARHPLLKRSWARIAISVDGTPVTRLIDTETGGFRDAVFGAAWPLAAWIVANWWNLLHEGRRTDNSSVRLAPDSERPWFHRHNLLTAQESSALPDLSICRDGPRCAVRWHADARTRPERGIRFIETGQAMLSVADCSEGLAHFVEATLAQCGGDGGSEYQELAADWAETRRLASLDLVVAERAARLGLDPFDPGELTAELDGLLRGLDLHRKLAEDLLEIATPGELRQSIDELRTALHDVLPGGARGYPTAVAEAGQRATQPYEAGYQDARRWRSELGLGSKPLRDLGALRVGLKRLGRWTTPGVVGLLGWRDGEYVFGMAPRPQRTERFAVARALFLAPPPEWGFGGRLVTDALSWEQAASRAFAAELLAPAEGLKSRLGRVADDATIADLADEFDVADRVIEHQIVNHRLAALAA